jgi:GNAT superfamily N-acetyltransferase
VRDKTQDDSHDTSHSYPMTNSADPASELSFRRMDSEDRYEAFALLSIFLREDEHYQDSSEAYGDGGDKALGDALTLFVERPDYGYVWLAFEGNRAVGAAVVSYAISTSFGGLVSKLEDCVVAPDRRGAGIGSAMLRALATELRKIGVGRIDLGVHVRNAGARRFYEHLGFASLHEERYALLL